MLTPSNIKNELRQQNAGGKISYLSETFSEPRTQNWIRIPASRVAFATKIPSSLFMNT